MERIEISSLTRKELNSHSNRTLVTPNKHNSVSSCNKAIRALKSSNVSGCRCHRSSAKKAQGVSYAELEIIMENVQIVKNKANAEISQLVNQCEQQSVKINQLTSTVKRLQNLEGTIETSNKDVESKYIQIISDLKSSGLQKEKSIEQLRAQIEMKQSGISILNEQLKANQIQISHLSQQLQQCANKYQKLTTMLQINEESHESKTIVAKYSGVPTLLSKITELETNCMHYTKQITNLESQVSQLKQHNSSSNKIIENLSTQNKQLVKKLNRDAQRIKQIGEQKQSLQNSIQDILAQHDRDKELIKLELEGVKSASESDIEKLQSAISGHKHQIRQLQELINLMKQQIQKNKQQNQYRVLVEEVCEDNEDYNKIIKRIQYLEKYRTEYYLNIEKIQYLCKMLDY